MSNALLLAPPTTQSVTEFLNCCAINLQHSKVASSELVRRSLSHQICFVTEPWLNNGKIRGLASPGWSTHSNGTRPRAAIRYRNTLKVWAVPEHSSRDMATVALSHKGRTIYFCSIYCDINLPVCSAEMGRLVDACRLSRMPLVLAGDVNAHSTLWGEENF